MQVVRNSAYSLPVKDQLKAVSPIIAFIDPFFSSGVHLALTGALSAAASIASSIRGEASEWDAARYHTGKVGISYTRSLISIDSSVRFGDSF